MADDLQQSLLLSALLFVFLCVPADIRLAAGELCHINFMAVPELGLCPHALPLCHRSGGDVLPGHRPLLP